MTASVTMGVAMVPGRWHGCGCPEARTPAGAPFELVLMQALPLAGDTERGMPALFFLRPLGGVVEGLYGSIRHLIVQPDVPRCMAW